jgi:hypothetical protein
MLKNGTPASPATARASQRLAGARRAHEQHALRDPAADRRVLPRVLQELDDLAELLLGLIDARHVPELHLDVRLGVDLRLAPGERHDAALRAAHTPHEERHDGHDEQEGQHPPQHFSERARQLALEPDLAGGQFLHELGVFDADRGEGHGLARPVLVSAPHVLRSDGDVRDLALRQKRLELGVLQLLALLDRGRHHVQRDQDHEQADANPGRGEARAWQTPTPLWRLGSGRGCHRDSLRMR